MEGLKTTANGTAWFSDFKIESSVADESNTWNFLFVLFNHMNVNIERNGKIENVQLNLTNADKEDMKECVNYFKTSMENLSKGKIKVRCEVVETEVPITQISHDDKNGYYVSGYDVKDVLDPYIEEGKYDHLFIIFRTGNVNQKGAIPVNDWVGLGSMEYRGLGFSNIRLPDSENDYVYKYNSRINTFPEEIYIHEFLHTLENNAQQYGYEIPALHDYEKYEYSSQPLVGLKQWYKDYMNCEIKTSSGYIGLPLDIFTKKPAKSTDFIYTHELIELKEPNNIIEELNIIGHKIKNLFSYVKGNKTAQLLKENQNNI